MTNDEAEQVAGLASVWFPDGIVSVHADTHVVAVRCEGIGKAFRDEMAWQRDELQSLLRDVTVCLILDPSEF